MTEFELKNTDHEDLEELLIRIEDSFHIRFEGNELLNIKTFGELCDLIIGKIRLESAEDCSSQQAFYKLRAALSSTLRLDKKAITPGLPLAEILSRKERRSRIKAVEEQLGFKLKLLRPPHWVAGILVIILLMSFPAFYFSWRLGLGSLAFSVAGFRIASKLGNEMNVTTVGQLAEKMVRENYIKSRRNPKTINKKEIEDVLKNWFCDELALNKEKLTRDTEYA